MPWCCRECIYIPLFVQADRRCKVASSSHEGQFPALHVHHTDNGFRLINYKIFSESHINPSWFLCGSSIPVELGFGCDGFCGGRDIGEHREKSPQIKARTNNKLEPQMAPGRNWTWAIGELGVLTPLHHPCSLIHQSQTSENILLLYPYNESGLAIIFLANQKIFQDVE